MRWEAKMTKELKSAPIHLDLFFGYHSHGPGRVAQSVGRAPDS